MTECRTGDREGWVLVPWNGLLQHDPTASPGCARMRVDAHTHTQPGPAAAPRPLPVRLPPARPPICCRRPAWRAPWPASSPRETAQRRFQRPTLPLSPTWGVVRWRCAVLFSCKSCPPPAITACTAASRSAVPAPSRSPEPGSAACPPRRRCHAAILCSAAPSSCPQHRDLPGRRHAARLERCFLGKQSSVLALERVSRPCPVLRTARRPPESLEQQS